LNPLALHEYNHRVRPKWLALLETLTAEEYTQTFPFGLGTPRRTAVHLGASEAFWLANLGARPDSGAFTEQNLPDVASLRAALDEQAQWIVNYMRGMDAAAWTKVAAYARRDGSILNISPEEVMTQLALHEVHHRAQLGAMMRMLGRDMSNLDFSRHLPPRG
jgi:uncharacterized damage-inducible protein DinB